MAFAEYRKLSFGVGDETLSGKGGFSQAEAEAVVAAGGKLSAEIDGQVIRWKAVASLADIQMQRKLHENIPALFHLDLSLASLLHLCAGETPCTTGWDVGNIEVRAIPSAMKGLVGFGILSEHFWIMATLRNIIKRTGAGGEPGRQFFHCI